MCGQESREGSTTTALGSGRRKLTWQNWLQRGDRLDLRHALGDQGEDDLHLQEAEEGPEDIERGEAEEEKRVRHSVTIWREM